MTWKSSLKIERADPSWPDSNTRHPYAGLAHLEEVFGALLSKIATRCLFELWGKSVHIGH
jgi:hypothetical protein